MQLGITTIQRNRAPWIKEWIAFHYLVGFRKFFVFLHRCSDNTEKILIDLKKNFAIEIVTVDPGLDFPQHACYQNSYALHGNSIDWMAFIDADEFLFPTQTDSMETALKEYNDKKEKSNEENALDKIKDFSRIVSPIILPMIATLVDLDLSENKV